MAMLTFVGECHHFEQPLDSVEAALLDLETIHHAVCDALDRQPPGEGDARALMLNLLDALPCGSHKDLAQLLGTSDQTIQRTLANPTLVKPGRRLQMVARLVFVLRRGWTPEGVVAWFYRPRPELGNRGVLEVIDEADLEQEVLDLAGHGRAQHGS
jgi:hypothetical protein